MEIFGRFKRKEPSPEVTQPEDDLQFAEERCRELGKQRESLQVEYRKMAAQYELLPDVMGTPHPQVGSPEIVALVADWWRGFIKRTDELTNAHNAAMQQVAAMKYHLGGF